MSKVRIWPGGVNMCCANCWAWSAYWSNLSGNAGVPRDEHLRELPHHSEQCDERQAHRKDWEVTEGTVPVLNVAPMSERHLREGRSRK